VDEAWTPLIAEFLVCNTRRADALLHGPSDLWPRDFVTPLPGQSHACRSATVMFRRRGGYRERWRRLRLCYLVTRSAAASLRYSPVHVLLAVRRCLSPTSSPVVDCSFHVSRLYRLCRYALNYLILLTSSSVTNQQTACSHCLHFCNSLRVDVCGRYIVHGQGLSHTSGFCYYTNKLYMYREQWNYFTRYINYFISNFCCVWCQLARFVMCVSDKLF